MTIYQGWTMTEEQALVNTFNSVAEALKVHKGSHALISLLLQTYEKSVRGKKITLRCVGGFANGTPQPTEFEFDTRMRDQSYSESERK